MVALCRSLLVLVLPAFLVGAIAAASPASAGSFRVNPVNPSIAPDRSTTSLSLANNGSKEVSVRVLTYRWTQVDGKDVYGETTNVIASPPIFTLAPGQTQLVRVGLKERRSGEAYRVVFEEIPSASFSRTVVQELLRLDLPLFVDAPAGKPVVDWQAWRDAAGEVTLEGRNSGTRQQKILTIDLDGKAGEDVILTREMGVVLPASARRWALGKRLDFAAGSAVTLKIRTPSGEVQRKVVVQPR